MICKVGKNMSVNIISILGEFGTLIGSLTSILLWLVTRSTLKEIKKQNNAFARSLESETISKIMNSHQTIFLNVLNNENLKPKFIGYSDDSSKFDEAIIGTLLINHFSMIYNFSQKGFLSEDDWCGLQMDISDAFSSLPIVRTRWVEIKKFYSIDFQEFIKKLTDHGRVI